ncbi:hypothetical protein R3Q16_31550 [Rhodococcus globerulus]|uniref:Mrr-like domain-containing protein n=1 Tax=Rhodococcus globerulus TaxID=33008 RepID=A0ABU4C4D9_RHOGO|nr:hypothetical protein [Rhodococcus globerulus]MDV6271164.1 hypothetical protein [Rhodococcus globerulus]
MGSVHEVIEAFRHAPSYSERGTKFEQLMVRYFELDPMFSQQHEKVWRWIDWPGRKGKTDTGIDLVARERDTGEYRCSLNNHGRTGRLFGRVVGAQPGSRWATAIDARPSRANK